MTLALRHLSFTTVPMRKKSMGMTTVKDTAMMTGTTRTPTSSLTTEDQSQLNRNISLVAIMAVIMRVSIQKRLTINTL